MRYLCLVYIDPVIGNAASKEEWAKDQAEAVEIAGRRPLTRVGSVEVRLTTGF